LQYFQPLPINWHFFFHFLFDFDAVFVVKKNVFWQQLMGLGIFAYNYLNPLPPSDAVRKQNIILEDLFSSVLSPFKKYHPSGNLKSNNLGIFQSLKLRIFVEKSFQFLFT